MRRERLRAALLALIVLAGPAAAAGEAEVRLVAAREGAAWVGENVPLFLELWTADLSFSNQSFVLPEVPGAYLLQPDSTTVKSGERRGGEPWQGLRYVLSLYPQRAGAIEIPSFEVRFSTRGAYGEPPVAHRLATAPLRVEARQPPGVSPASLLVTTRRFTVEAAWEPAAEAGDGALALETGDALVLTVAREAAEVPGMVFEPVPEIRIDGLGVYPDPPEVRDRVDRGSLTGVRTDRVTVVCERPGSYVLPGLEFQWWDPQREELATRSVDPLRIEVTANAAWGAPAAAETGAGQGGATAWGAWAWLLPGLFLLWWPGWPLLRAAGRRLGRALAPRRLAALNPGPVRTKSG